MKETTEKEIFLPEFTEISMRLLCEYLYSGTVHISNVNDAIALLSTCNFTLDRDLKKLCEENIEKHIDTENAMDIYLFAEENQAEALRTHSFEFMRKNFFEVRKAEKFFRLDPSLIERLYKVKGFSSF